MRALRVSPPARARRGAALASRAFMTTVEAMKRRQGRSRKQPARRDRGSGSKPGRQYRRGGRTSTGEPQSDLEEQLAASGRTGRAPKLGGTRARGGRGSRAPAGGPYKGSVVAPTKKAEARERQRHSLQRGLGVVPAGEAGNRRQRRGPKATRPSLDAAARQADERVR